MQETLYLDAALYDYKSVKLLSELAAPLVSRLVVAGLKGRVAALQLMRSTDTVTRKSLYSRGDKLFQQLETFHRNATCDLVWIGLSLHLTTS